MRRYVRQQLIIPDSGIISYYASNDNRNRLNWIINNAHGQYIKNRKNSILETITTGKKSPIIDFMNNLERIEAIENYRSDEWILFHGLNVGAGKWIPTDGAPQIIHSNPNVVQVQEVTMPYVDSSIFMKSFNDSNGDYNEKIIEVVFATNNYPVNSGLINWVFDNMYFDIKGNVDETYIGSKDITDSLGRESTPTLDKMNKLVCLHRYNTEMSNWTYFTEVNIN